MPFSDIYGHEKQINLIRTVLAQGRLPHAYLFYGSPGLGKKKTALTLAQALNCLKDRSEYDACGVCNSCKKIDGLNHPDVSILKADGQFIRIDMIREMQEQMKYQPFEGQVRVFILVDADKMNPPAANALLKTLEEPTGGNLLILISSRPHMLPLTIISRCQQMRFSPLPQENIVSYLNNECSLPPGEATILARASGSSIGRALELMNETCLAMRKDMVNKFSRITDPLVQMSFFDDLGESKEILIEKLKILKSCYRDIMVYRATGRYEGLINTDIRERIKYFSENITLSDAAGKIDTIDKAIWAIGGNGNKQLTLDVMLFKIAH